MEVSDSFDIYQQSDHALTVEGGDYSTGYGLINGANMDVGGCELSVKLIKTDEITYRIDVEFVFNDIIDMGEYRLDWIFVHGARAKGFKGEDYILRIRGSFSFYYSDGVDWDSYGDEVYNYASPKYDGVDDIPQWMKNIMEIL